MCDDPYVCPKCGDELHENIDDEGEVFELYCDEPDCNYVNEDVPWVVKDRHKLEALQGRYDELAKEYNQMQESIEKKYLTCPECHESGQVEDLDGNDYPCPVCKGKGRFDLERLPDDFQWIFNEHAMLKDLFNSIVEHVTGGQLSKEDIPQINIYNANYRKDEIIKAINKAVRGAIDRATSDAYAIQEVPKELNEKQITLGNEIIQQALSGADCNPWAHQTTEVGSENKDAFDLVRHLHHVREWSGATFGPGERHIGISDHIRKELDEIARSPYDLSEWIDVVILGLDGAWRAGHEPEAIVNALQEKQAKNEARIWPDWREVPPGTAIEHIRNIEPQNPCQYGHYPILDEKTGIRYCRDCHAVCKPWPGDKASTPATEQERPCDTCDDITCIPEADNGEQFCSKEPQSETLEKCPDCGGIGETHDGWVCHTCDGDGLVNSRT